MIVVTVGNALQPFGRLLEAVDALAVRGVLGSEDLLLQTGHAAAFAASHGRLRAFWPMDEFQRALQDASLVITHGGCTALEVIALGKLPVVMPRARRYAEHVNDHQILFARALAAQGRIVPAYEAHELAAAVAEVRRRGGRQSSPLPASTIRELVRQSIEEFAR